MTKVRNRHNAEFKSKVAVEAIKEQKADTNVSPRPSHLFHRKLKRDNVHDFQ